MVANRAAGQVVKFTPGGEFIETFENIPEESLVCNVSFKDQHFFFNALKAIGDQKSAPIYAHTGNDLVSTIIPGDLDIPVFDQHSSCMATSCKRPTLFAGSWLEQRKVCSVKNGEIAASLKLPTFQLVGDSQKY